MPRSESEKSGLRAASTFAFFLASAALCLWYLLWFGPACLQLEPWAWPACFGLYTVIFFPPLFPLGEDLRRRCRAEFRRRLYTPKYRAARLAVLLYFALLIPLSAEYIINTANFGKGWPAMWGYAAILVSVIAFAALLFARPGRRAGWNVLWGCFSLCALMQGPPLFWWGLYAGGAFEFSGVMVPGYIAFPVHAALLAGALAGTALARRCGTAFGLTGENTPLFG